MKLRYSYFCNFVRRFGMNIYSPKSKKFEILDWSFLKKIYNTSYKKKSFRYCRDINCSHDVTSTSIERKKMKKKGEGQAHVTLSRASWPPRSSRATPAFEVVSWDSPLEGQGWNDTCRNLTVWLYNTVIVTCFPTAAYTVDLNV